MKIVLTGGGTGGHITPTLAVAREIKRLQPSTEITYILERKSKFAHLVYEDAAIDRVKIIFAGKLRRYHGESWLTRLTDIKTIALNIRDVVYLTIGFVQSLLLIGRIKPAAVFVKGGYVGLPVGAASAFWHRPIITHDSDTLPGLTNKIVSRWAKYTLTAFPADFYRYPAGKIKHVGVPVGDDFEHVDKGRQNELRDKIGVPHAAKLLFITGGSLGAKRLNQAVAEVVPKLLESNQELLVIHQTGKTNGGIYGSIPKRVIVEEFVQPLSAYSGAADIVIARPGATTIAELASQKKACIVVPSPFLAGGHQLTNAAHLSEQHAVIDIQEGRELAPQLQMAVQELLEKPEIAKEISQNLHQLLVPQAAHKIAVLLLDEAQKRQTKK